MPSDEELGSNRCEIVDEEDADGKKSMKRNSIKTEIPRGSFVGIDI